VLLNNLSNINGPTTLKATAKNRFAIAYFVYCNVVIEKSPKCKNSPKAYNSKIYNFLTKFSFKFLGNIVDFINSGSKQFQCGLQNFKRNI